ncbi:putative Dol-P-Glc:Glc(2)Man(9)GlcNAc(2)-PP-Dol alpha-1,2-glucosyltransferase isoform X1 [Myzus persicae]|uniref:putative Dol-P-Glc:Glc(2)Man(9)GlcNAc(2)-PP-Dol alpha-1,2-glucosyltransferase isoform X1 n=1 Tax=Myzus persicae TaxID=13164 RepID=UPI000B9327AC|nr:putative Dol-P-Glc:Glc(2)Man(9)GlcNAc(2)-PP-Dol alpha-1,2-glucosyltransferase isoform X1 [Myzus persicae]
MAPKVARNGRQKPLAQYSETVCGLNVPILPAVVLSIVTWYLLRYVVQPLFGTNEYYIDEEFHVPQARHYCQGEFHKWDPKITTLPGLYLLSSTVLVPFMKIYDTILSLLGLLDNDVLHVSDPCSLVALRAVNAVGAPACLYYAFYRCQLLLFLNENKKTKIAKWSFVFLALSVATFPVIYAPYSMLYYTDAWATASVFLWYSSHLSNETNFLVKIIFGGFSVLCRQTNIAWLVFASIIDVCHCAEQCFPAIKNIVSIFSYIQATIIEFYHCCSIKKKNKSKKLIEFFQKCIRVTSPNIVVILSFFLFVVLLNNGDIVVGDRRAHIPRFHPMQLCYFVLFVLSFSLPWLLSQAYFGRQTSNSISKYFNLAKAFREIHNNTSKVLVFTILIIISGLVHFNTIAHPYLLADNRHYIFYVWRLLFSPGKPVFLRYLPVPLYAYGLWLVDRTLMQSSIAYRLAYWIVTPLILCAQFLLEPRYFVVPYLMYRLHSNKQLINGHTFKAAFIEFIAYQVFNFVIMRIFLYSPFVSTMDNTGRLDRFTW